MPYCGNCGASLEVNSTYCGSCGNRVYKSAMVTPVALAKGAFGRIFGSDAQSVYFDAEVLPLVQEVVTSANSWVTFVTPYVGLWGHLRNALEECVSRGVGISFVVRAGEEKQVPETIWLREHGIHVYEVDNLHAKIYLNEESVVVSSMNIYGSSTINSLDYAVVIRNEKDAEQVRDYVTRLTARASGSKSTKAKLQVVRSGYCIRDGVRVSFDTERPLCSKCYATWMKYENVEYGENYCHLCGQPRATTYARPLCTECYKKTR